MDDDYDTPWKEVVTQHFPDFMAFYFGAAHAAIDWSRPHAFLDQELASLSRDAEQGRRLLDKLVQVYLRDGGEQWVLVHLEVQGWRDAGFAERVFQPVCAGHRRACADAKDQGEPAPPSPGQMASDQAAVSTGLGQAAYHRPVSHDRLDDALAGRIGSPVSFGGVSIGGEGCHALHHQL